MLRQWPGESRPPAVFVQHRHTAELHSTRVSSKRAVSDMADRTHMPHFHWRSASGGSCAAERAGRPHVTSGALCFMFYSTHSVTALIRFTDGSIV